VLCYFDDENPVHFDRIIGSRYCGFQTRIIGSGSDWPEYVKDLFYEPTGDFAFDNVIYINGRTSLGLASTIITLAHEVQHFMQYGYSRKVWMANTLIYQLLRQGPPTQIKAWDIPSEHDAISVSKRVAEELIGAESLAAYADAQIAAQNDPEKWKFFRDLSVSTPFDLLAQTKPWVAKYREHLIGIQQRDVDFAQGEWWN